MSQGDKIQELQRRIDELSTTINSSAQELSRIKAELQTLSGGEPLPTLEPLTSEAPTAPAGIENFIGLKLIHVIGIIALVIGISIGVKYAIDRELISELMRIVLA